MRVRSTLDLPWRRTGASAPSDGLWVAKALYFVFYAGIGVISPFYNVFLQQRGLSGAEIGWLGSIAPLAALLANPIWGAVADRWQQPKMVLVICAVAAGAVTPFFLLAGSFWTLLPLVILLYVFRTPIGSLMDSAVIEMMRRTGGNYGAQRLWGSIGYILASFIIGLSVSGGSAAVIFWVYGALLIFGVGGLSLLLPPAAPTPRANLLAGMRRLAGQPGYLSFLGAAALMGLGMFSAFAFLGLHVLELGGSERQVGIVFALNAILEVPVMYYGARVVRRVGGRSAIVIGLGMLGTAWLLIGLAQTPLQLMAAMPLVGVAFSLFWVAAVAYAADAAPPGMGATSQSLVGAAQAGVGPMLGAVLAGYLWDWQGGPAVFLMGVGATYAGLLLFWLGSRGGDASPA